MPHPEKDYNSSILTLQIIVNDIKVCEKNYDSFHAILQKRLKIEKQYSEKLEHLSKSIHKESNNQNKPSNKILFMLQHSIFEQSKLSKEFINKIQQQIFFEIAKYRATHENQVKKLSLLTKNIQKDFQTERQKLTMIQVKYKKKCEEQIQSKTNYLAGLSNVEMGFQKKNKLFLKVNNVQKQFKSIDKQYHEACEKNNQYFSQKGKKLIEVIQRLEQIDRQKVNLMRIGYMRLTQAKSVLGALNVQQTSRILTEVDTVLQEYTQFPNEMIGFIEHQLNNYHIQYENPTQYITNLFKRTNSKITDELISYGDTDHKTFIDYILTQKEQAASSRNTNGKDNVQYSSIIKLLTIFTNIFDENNQTTKEDIAKFKQIITINDKIRKDFILCLQKFRLMGKFEIKSIKLETIKQCLNIYLNECYNCYDTYNAKQLMVLSLSYYIKKQDNQKVYLQEYLKDHKIWKSIRWWECALLESVYEQTRVKNKKQSSAQITIWDIKGAGNKQQQHEQFVYHNIVFNQMAYYVHNMGLFSLNDYLITKFCKKFTKLFSLPENMKHELMKIISGLYNTTIQNLEKSSDEQSPSLKYKNGQ